MSKETQISRKISYLLRHNPEDLVMDKEGWVRVNDLLFKLDIHPDLLDAIVENNDKKRFAFSEDGVYIRANQGHGKKMEVDVTYKEIQFPTNYYHGTASMNLDSIMVYGLNPKNRKHVHLSHDIDTARNVGSRHSHVIAILIIDGNQMKRDGYKLYISENNVVLADEVPSKYIKIHK